MFLSPIILIVAAVVVLGLLAAVGYAIYLVLRPSPDKRGPG